MSDSDIQVFVPEDPFGPHTIQLSAIVLDASVDWCRSRGISVSDSGRQVVGMKQLAHWANEWDRRGPIEPTVEQLNALNLALDLDCVMRAIRGDIPPGFLGTITRATRGSLRGDDANQQPFDAQTELCAVSMFVFASLAVGSPQPQANRRTVDLVVTHDSVDISVEVKRPKDVPSAIKAVRAAARQIRAYDAKQPGAILVDAAQLIRSDGRLSALAAVQSHAVLEEIHHAVLQEFSSPAGRQLYRQVILVSIYYRRAAWRGGAAVNTMDLSSMLHDSAYDGEMSGEADWLLGAMRRGMDEMSNGGGASGDQRRTQRA